MLPFIRYAPFDLFGFRLSYVWITKPRTHKIIETPVAVLSISGHGANLSEEPDCGRPWAAAFAVEVIE
jgi:hypothetical protein